MKTQEIREKLGELVMRAMDQAEQWDEDFDLVGAIICYEVVDKQGRSTGSWHSTGGSSAFNLGVLELTRASILSDSG